MKTLKIRNLILGEGIPKICVPIVGITKKEILDEAKSIYNLPVDMVEWRADCFKDISNHKNVLEVLCELRKTLQEMPILFTFRTAKEGGEKTISLTDYIKLNKAITNTGFVDLIDIEAFTGDDVVMSIISEAHKNNVKVIASNHDFEKTPSKNELLSRLCKMQKLRADIAKIAVMPNNKMDTLTLLEATIEMNEKYAKIPIVSISMAQNGLISRFSGEIFGSAITFGSAKKASAPGQIGVEDLQQLLTIIHKN